MTSFDVVARVRRAVGEKRVGHAGTLDPAATGVLVVGIGQATKLLGQLTLDRKGYRATFQLGAETTTDDAEGEVTHTAEVPDDLLDEGRASWQVELLEGVQDQVPPAFSAVSVGGRRAYDAARAGEALELAPRRVRVFGARLVEVRPEERSWVVDLDVSKGTYVRSIARDLGRELGCYAHVSALRRTFSGPVTLADCVSLEELEAGGAELVRGRCLDPVAVLGLPARELDVSEVVDVSCGRRIEAGTVRDGVVERAAEQGERVALTFSGALAGIWERRGASLACVSNFPQAIEGVRQPVDLRALCPEAPLDEPSARRLLRAAETVPRAYRGGPGDTVLDGASTVEIALPYERPVFGVRVVDGVAEGFSSLDHVRELLGDDRRFVCAIGAFDGLHRGHRALLARARAEARRRGCRLAAVTFSPDPSHVLEPARPPRELMSDDERTYGLLDAGVDALLVFEFTPELAAVPFERFVREALPAGMLDVRAVVVGSDFRLGAGGAGTVDALAALGRENGFDVVGVPLAEAGGAPVTATRIRDLLGEGRVEDAADLLGRCHHVSGTVAHGRGEGTGFGFPTANVVVNARLCLPAEGVYAGYVLTGRPGHETRTAWPAAINVGKPRSFSPGEEGEPFLEATLLGFSGDLYDEYVDVVFLRWLRAPQVFGSVEELERVVLGNVEWVRKTLGERGVELSGGCA